MDPSVIALLVQLATALFIPIAGVLGTVAVQKIKLNALNIKGKTWENTKLIINTAVMATEKQAKSGVVKKSDKKEYAMGIAAKMLESKGIKIDKDILSEMIEAQVWEVITPTVPVVPPVATPVVPPVVEPVPAPVVPPVIPPVVEQEPLG